MADNKSKRGARDRRRVAGGEGYEVNYFARKHRITAEQARSLIKQIGNNREKLNAAAAKVTKKKAAPKKKAAKVTKKKKR